MISYSCSAKLMTVLVFFYWNANCIHCDTPTREKLIKENKLKENETSSAIIDILNIAEEALRSAKHHAKVNARTHFPSNPMDCAEIYERNKDSDSKIYEIWPRNRIAKSPLKVYCDMDDDGGGWTVIQRRGDYDSLKDYFYRDWVSYKKGFGDSLKDFWLGNDNIFALTNQRANTVKFILSDWEGNTTYATYDEFWIDDEYHNYTLHVEGYRGTAGDSFSYSNNIPFSTKDKDNDNHNSHCAATYKGAWWYKACHLSNLNGYYLKGAHESTGDGVQWTAFRGQKYSLKNTVIKIRPKTL